MRFLLKVLSTLAGFIFTVGGPWKASAQELPSNTVGTAVIARENPNPTMKPGWYDSERNQILSVAAEPAKAKDKDTKDTKPTKKSKSPRKQH